MKKFKKSISLILSVLLVFLSFAFPAFAAFEKVDYKIQNNPYANVDWDSWKPYKVQLHCQTNASDGYMTIHEVIQADYDYGYDAVAVTDHGTINQGWNNQPNLVPLVRAVKYERTQLKPIEPLTEEEYKAYTTGTALTTDGEQRGPMTDIQKGIELNMATPFADCHLTGYWSDYGQGLAGVYGDYETPAREVNKAGGVTMLAHVAEFVYVKEGADTIPDHAGQKNDEYYVNKFARIFLDNAGSCVGMGVNSAEDWHTATDRILYDQILEKTIPNGVIPWGFCFSDSHNYKSINDAWQVMYMPENTNESIRNCMVGGQMFAVSHFSRGKELNGMKEMPNFSDNTAVVEKNNTPLVTKVDVDDENDTITVNTENATQITWVSNGNVIKREDIKGGTASLDLNDSKLLDTPEMYVRFYVTGENGICYSEPITFLKGNEQLEPVDVPETHDISTFLRGLVTVLDWFHFKWDPIVWMFKAFALGYDPFKQIISSFQAIS